MSSIIYLAIPVFLATMCLEAVLRRHRASNELVGYGRRDTAASLAMGVGNVVVSAAFQVPLLIAYTWLYQHRLFDIGTGPAAWVLLFFAEDLTYYWWHRASHEVRFLWAAHVNHHSSQHYNLSTALRQSWTTPLTTPLFYWWLPFFGFHPAMLYTQIALSLLYQFWLHTELIGRLGPLEWLFNTPSHHRVHHGTNSEYLDRNHAGILILWDRLFGTFEPERAPVRYGLTKNIDTFNPVRIAFHEWIALMRDASRATRFRDVLGHVFFSPSWSTGSANAADPGAGSAGREKSRTAI